jgi:hypothetical protein
MARPRKQVTRVPAYSVQHIAKVCPGMMNNILVKDITREERVARKNRLKETKFDSKWDEIVAATKKLGDQ